MRVSIGHRLFASVLLAILAVAATAIALMRQNVMNSFGEYAVNIELDRLEQLSGELARQYQVRRNWNFIPLDRTGWISAELARLQSQRLLVAPPVPPVPPVQPVAPVAPVQPAAPMGEPPIPPIPPEPVAPPLPPPEMAPPAPQPEDPDLVDQLGLQDRVTLLDAGGAYLAGRRPGDEPSARRAIVAAGRQVGYLVVAKAERPSDAMAGAFQKQMKDSLLIILAASLALSGLAAVLLAAHFRKPILRLADGARELADGKYDTRLPVARSDELGELAHSFNQLAQKLDQVEASRRQWVADTSHELRTPLSVLRAQLEAVQDGVRPASAEGTAAMLRQVLSLNKLIDQLYALARADVGEIDYQREAVDLCQLAREQGRAFSEKFAAAGITLADSAVDGHFIVQADPERMRQVLTNLFENCIRYCGQGATIVLGAGRDGDVVELRFDDSGPGVPDAALAHLGERFYRVEGSRSREHGGAGLGLALCRRIVLAHGGQLLFARSPHGGLQVSLRLPKASP
jgi:two-component system sensor histidine kinase BaeS